MLTVRAHLALTQFFKPFARSGWQT